MSSHACLPLTLSQTRRTLAFLAKTKNTMDYDKIGATYTSTRQADPRIGSALEEQLGLATGSKLIDIGAGTGNYSHYLAELGFEVTALEPSSVMRNQGKQHPRLTWISGVAESLPFPDGHFHGAVMTLSLHHFSDWKASISQALRVSGGGPLVIFAFDPAHTADFWLFDYFPSLAKLDAGFEPSFAELESCILTQGLGFNLRRFPLPADLVDHFAAAGWARPRIYLQESFQRGISTFSKLDEKERVSGQTALKRDLDDGQWDAKYGHLKDTEFHDRGYGFIRVEA